MTIYDIKKGDEVVFENTNTACFAEIFNYYYDYCLVKLDGFAAYSVEFLPDNRFSKEEMQKFLRLIKSFGVFAKCVEIPEKEKEHWNARPDVADCKFKIVLKFSDYESVNFVKFAIHVARSLIEDYNAVKNFISTKKPRGIEYWQHFRICSSFYSDGHCYFGGIVYRSWDETVSVKSNPRFIEAKSLIRNSSFGSVTQSSVKTEEIYSEKQSLLTQGDLRKIALRETRKLNKKNKEKV